MASRVIKTDLRPQASSAPTYEPVDPLHLEHLELLLELSLPLSLLLSAADKEGLAADLPSVEVVAGSLGLLGLLETDEAEAPALPLLGLHQLKCLQKYFKT